MVCTRYDAKRKKSVKQKQFTSPLAINQSIDGFFTFQYRCHTLTCTHTAFTAVVYLFARVIVTDYEFSFSTSSFFVDMLWPNRCAYKYTSNLVHLFIIISVGVIYGDQLLHMGKKRKKRIWANESKRKRESE